MNQFIDNHQMLFVCIVVLVFILINDAIDAFKRK